MNPSNGCPAPPHPSTASCEMHLVNCRLAFPSFGPWNNPLNIVYSPRTNEEELAGMANGQNGLFSAIVCWQMVGRKTSAERMTGTPPIFFVQK